MKKVLFILSIFIFNFTQSQIVNIPDVNFKNALLNISTINTNNDGEIQINEVQNVSYLNIGGRQISDLTGIEEFTNLTILDCRNNQLLNVNISNNLNLNTLNCSQNQITTLNLNNSNLSRLICSNNQITILDLSNVINLNSLDCTNTQITTLDLSNQDNFEIIETNNNPNLTYINLKNGNNHNIIFEGAFENLPNLETVCVDDENSDFSNNMNNTGHSVNFTENCNSALIVNETTLLNFSIFPIPTENILNVKSEKEITKIIIYNKLGQLVIKNTAENRIDISNLTQGLYFVKVEDVNGNFGMKKIVKK